VAGGAVVAEFAGELLAKLAVLFSQAADLLADGVETLVERLA
jgi:hypothetical protein